MHWMPVPLAVSLALAASAGLAADSPLRPERMREAMGLKLGAWRSTSRLVDVQVTPAPGGNAADAERAAAAIRAQFGGNVADDQCLWDDRERLYLPGMRDIPGCDFSRLEARDGRFALTASCRHAQPEGTVEFAIEGRYAPERMTARSRMTASTSGLRARIEVETESRFTGECALPPVILTPPAK